MGNFITRFLPFQDDLREKWSIIEINEHTDLDKYRRSTDAYKGPETPWDRVKLIFETDAYGDSNPHFVRIKDATLISLLMGGLIGGINRSHHVFKEHFRLTAHEVFETPQHAQKMLQDKVFIGFGQGFFKLGWRFSLFSFIYMTSAAAISQYRGKVGVLDQVGGAATAGFLYKFYQGPKASAAGLIAGGGLGLVVGLVQASGNLFVGKDIQNANEWQRRRQEAERVRHTENLKVQRSKIKDPDADLMHFHENFIADDDMSYSVAKGTPIGQIKQALEQKLVSASEFATLPPKAAEREFKEARESEEKAKKAYLQRTAKKEVKEEEKETEKENEDESKSAVEADNNSSTEPANTDTESSAPKVNTEVIIEKVEETSPEKPKQVKKIVDPRIYTFKSQDDMPRVWFKREKLVEPPQTKVEVKVEI